MRGDRQRAFAEAAAEDGIVLTGQSVDWLCRRGHLALPDGDETSSARAALERIYLALGGDLAKLATGKLAKLPGDFIHEPTGTLIEVDESQHFTSFRLATLNFYPEDARIGFHLATYKQLCGTRRTPTGATGTAYSRRCPSSPTGGRVMQQGAGVVGAGPRPAPPPHSNLRKRRRSPAGPTTDSGEAGPRAPCTPLRNPS